MTITTHAQLCSLVSLSNYSLLMLRFVLIQFFYLSISLEEFDDFSESGSDYEATMKATKRRKQTALEPRVNFLNS